MRYATFFGLLLVAADIAAALELKVDIGATDQVVKAGWTEWSEPRLDPGPPSAQKAFGDVTVALTQTGGELTGELVCVDNQVGRGASKECQRAGFSADFRILLGRFWHVYGPC
ncbi:MAG: hypothetical protein ACYTEQ_23000 [Planctomycetota bacterium]